MAQGRNECVCVCLCVFAFLSLLQGWHKRARQGLAPASRPSLGRFRPRAAFTRHPARTQHCTMPASTGDQSRACVASQAPAGAHVSTDLLL
jgi:hypothetical protein